MKTSNTFIGGLVTDYYPLTVPNTVLVDALNATIITTEGNEKILQNDYGNEKIPDKNTFVKLSEGFIPIGIKEYHGVIYIVSYNPKTKYGEIGSYPSPNYALDIVEHPKPLLNIYQPLKNFVVSNDKDITEDKIHYLTTPLFNFDLNHPVDIEIQDSYDGSVNLIINDYKNIPRLINTRFSVLENGLAKIPKRHINNDNLYSGFTDNESTPTPNPDPNPNPNPNPNPEPEPTPEPQEQPNAIDLGLSVKWADRNLNGYYIWAEPNDLFHIGGTKYDIATKLLGSNWRMPTEAELYELYMNCERQASDKGVTFKNNNNSIFLPFGGYINTDNKLYGEGNFGKYWSDQDYTYKDTSKKNAYALTITKDSSYTSKLTKDIKALIRPVFVPKNIVKPVNKEAVDLDLPSKTLWSKGNLKKDGTFDDKGDRFKYDPEEILKITKNKWRLPTAKEYEELLHNTEYKYMGDRSYSNWVGKNDNYISFYMAGYYNNAGPKFVGEDGWYWTSDLGSNDAVAKSAYMKPGPEGIVETNKNIELPVKLILNE